MTTPIRVRRHTDGRVAYLAEPDDSNPWLVYMPWPILTPHGNTLWAEERDVSGDGWSELLVAELPEPDATPSANTQIWTIDDDWLAVEHGEFINNGLARDPDQTRAEALKMLAAVAACERYRAEREAT
jgi:hypothetical protein